MPMIRVEMFEGRSDEQKRALVDKLTDAFVEAAGGSRDAVDVILYDVPKANWGIGGALAKDKYPD